MRARDRRGGGGHRGSRCARVCTRVSASWSGPKPAGIAVHIGARVLGMAEPGEVLVSRTVKDLVAGSGNTFDDRGEHTLKGVPGTWQLYAVRR